MTSLFKTQAFVRLIFISLIGLVTVSSFHTVSLNVDLASDVRSLSQSVNVVEFHLETENQEKNSSSMADSVEFYACVSHSYNNVKAIYKVFDLCRPQYTPPYLEKELRPPQRSFA